MNPIKAAVVQAAPVLFDTPKTIEKLVTLTRDAAGRGANLVVFPEAFVGGYPKGLREQWEISMDQDHHDDTIRCDDLPWLPLAPMVFVKVIKLVPETGGFSVMIRAEPGASLPRHKHLESAEIYILKGEGVHPQTGAFRQGDYVSERKGAVHEELPFDVETELLMICNGPSAFLGPNDEVRYLFDIPMLQRLSQYAPVQGRAS